MKKNENECMRIWAMSSMQLQKRHRMRMNLTQKLPVQIDFNANCRQMSCQWTKCLTFFFSLTRKHTIQPSRISTHATTWQSLSSYTSRLLTVFLSIRHWFSAFLAKVLIPNRKFYMQQKTRKFYLKIKFPKMREMTTKRRVNSVHDMFNYGKVFDICMKMNIWFMVAELTTFHVYYKWKTNLCVCVTYRVMWIIPVFGRIVLFRNVTSERHRKQQQ